jgi:hypothetical protein|tara:strand:- start:597 stop:779 length:183 start_codon:yes stop_codon:yes gene_type:complete
MHVTIINTTQEHTRVRLVTPQGIDILKIPNEERNRFDSDPETNDQYFLEFIKDQFEGAEV